MTETKHTPGPWEYIPSTEHHGPYVVGPHGGDICDCYTMSNLAERSVRNGGDSKPILFFHEMADPNARLMAAAPELLAAILLVREIIKDASATGFNCRDGDWAERLYASQAQTFAAVAKAIAGRQ
jgi:hypothetical protein